MIVVTNNGPSFAPNSTIVDLFLVGIEPGALWMCAASSGAASGTGSLNTTVNLAVNGTATYSVTAIVAPSATGGTGTVSFTVSAGTLPAGLILTSAGLLSGTPTAQAITSNFTVSATDGFGCVRTRAYTIAVGVNCPIIPVNPASLPNATIGTAYSQTFTATGGTGTISFSVSVGTLPAGLTLTSAGVLSGTASSNASATFTFQSFLVLFGTGLRGRSALESVTATLSTAGFGSVTLPVTYAGAQGFGRTRSNQPAVAAQPDRTRRTRSHTDG